MVSHVVTADDARGSALIPWGTGCTRRVCAVGTVLCRLRDLAASSLASQAVLGTANSSLVRRVTLHDSGRLHRRRTDIGQIT